MKHIYNQDNRNLKIILDEDLDMDICRTIRTIIDGYLMKYNPSKCLLDMKDVKFMDSSGLGFIVGRCNLASMIGCKIVILNVDSNMKKLLDMSNVKELVEVK